MKGLPEGIIFFYIKYKKIVIIICRVSSQQVLFLNIYFKIRIKTLWCL